LITAPLKGTILPGVTRDSVIQLAKSWGVKVTERRLSMEEVMGAIAEGTLREAFASGTAAVVSPVGQIYYRGTEHFIGDGKAGKLTERLYNEILQIQYGQKDDPFGWRIKIAD
jgi:branched-chain amino acid aminotransferase